MENIKHFFGVDLSTSSIRNLSKKNNGKLLFPYKDVVITVNEVHICPFCGKTVDNFQCNCKKFKAAFSKLQNSYSDKKHESILHLPPFNAKMAFSKSISDFKVKTLTKEEILALGLDLWDFATRHTDSDRSYLITPANQDGDKLFLLCKDLISKEVYRFETTMVNHKDTTIYLGIRIQKTISGGSKRLGDYHIVDDWKNLKEFKDWNEVCKALREVRTIN